MLLCQMHHKSVWKLAKTHNKYGVRPKFWHNCHSKCHSSEHTKLQVWAHFDKLITNYPKISTYCTTTILCTLYWLFSIICRLMYWMFSCTWSLACSQAFLHPRQSFSSQPKHCVYIPWSRRSGLLVPPCHPAGGKWPTCPSPWLHSYSFWALCVEILGRYTKQVAPKKTGVPAIRQIYYYILDIFYTSLDRFDKWLEKGNG